MICINCSAVILGFDEEHTGCWIAEKPANALVCSVGGLVFHKPDWDMEMLAMEVANNDDRH